MGYCIFALVFRGSLLEFLLGTSLLVAIVRAPRAAALHVEPGHMCGAQEAIQGQLPHNVSIKRTIALTLHTVPFRPDHLRAKAFTEPGLMHGSCAMSPARLP